MAWARIMGHTTAARLLQLNLNEEGDADQKLSNLADQGINQKASNAAHVGSGGDADRPARKKGSKKR